MVNRSIAKILIIAGSDSGGGAGIQADLKTVSALGGYGTTALTAVTAQNTRGVFGVSDLSPSFVADQIQCILSDIGADVVKVGMLSGSPIIRAVAEALSTNIPIVLDPVMVAKGGAILLQEEAKSALISLLIPRAFLLTPNLPEASELLGRPVLRVGEMEQAAKDLTLLGASAVLLKGGHLDGDTCSDCLYIQYGADAGVHWFHKPMIKTPNTHGTGCTYSSAIATFLAQGAGLYQAVFQAREYLDQAIKQGALLKIGSGHGPVHHFHRQFPLSEN